eukprot:GFYU01006817.1.p1 GENE.GFYU01006817.1~~GFYU01006817.1.p1  ORF type:complete len:687 (+),score=149.28 GFYU01006817.1:123-2183(+)
MMRWRESGTLQQVVMLAFTTTLIVFSLQSLEHHGACAVQLESLTRHTTGTDHQATHAAAAHTTETHSESHSESHSSFPYPSIFPGHAASRMSAGFASLIGGSSMFKSSYSRYHHSFDTPFVGRDLSDRLEEGYKNKHNREKVDASEAVCLKEVFGATIEPTSSSSCSDYSAKTTAEDVVTMVDKHGDSLQNICYDIEDADTQKKCAKWVLVAFLSGAKEIFNDPTCNMDPFEWYQATVPLKEGQDPEATDTEDMMKVVMEQGKSCKRFQRLMLGTAGESNLGGLAAPEMKYTVVPGPDGTVVGELSPGMCVCERAPYESFYHEFRAQILRANDDILAMAENHEISTFLPSGGTVLMQLVKWMRDMDVVFNKAKQSILSVDYMVRVWESKRWLEGVDPFGSTRVVASNSEFSPELTPEERQRDPAGALCATPVEVELTAQTPDNIVAGGNGEGELEPIPEDPSDGAPSSHTFKAYKETERIGPLMCFEELREIPDKFMGMLFAQANIAGKTQARAKKQLIKNRVIGRVLAMGLSFIPAAGPYLSAAAKALTNPHQDLDEYYTAVYNEVKNGMGVKWRWPRDVLTNVKAELNKPLPKDPNSAIRQLKQELCHIVTAMTSLQERTPTYCRDKFTFHHDRIFKDYPGDLIPDFQCHSCSGDMTKRHRVGAGYASQDLGSVGGGLARAMLG